MRAKINNLLRRVSLASAATLIAFAASAQATTFDLGSTTRATPYERYMNPVKKVLNNLEDSDPASLSEVGGLMRRARAFRYAHNVAYLATSPEETARRRSGDCKDKSLWLVDAMGDANVRFVIGRLSSRSRINHAWVYWQHDGEWFVLDPTNTDRPIPVNSLRTGSYVPFYSYGVGRAFQHDAVAPAFASRTVAVADHGSKKSAQTKTIASRSETPVKSAKAIKVAKAGRATKVSEPIAEAPLKLDGKKGNAKRNSFAARLAAMEGGTI